jgi:hypothetical protein
MNKWLKLLPTILVVLVCALAVFHGPVLQLDHYHDFADQTVWLGIPHSHDVLSNLGFLVVGGYGLARLWPVRDSEALRAGWPAYLLFLIALILTAFGSGYYHWAPDNSRLIWDRIPIAMATAGLLGAVRAETQPGSRAVAVTLALGVLAVISVFWWTWTDHLHNEGDLRPYLLLQVLAIVLIPLWQTLYHSPKPDRIAYAAAFGFYVLAKITELYDHELLNILHVVSGHTLKHLLATVAAALIVRRLILRTAG